MKILHVLPGLNPRSGGPVRSVTGLCRGLAKGGVNTVLFVHSPEYLLVEPITVRFLVGRGIGLGTIIRDAIHVMDEIKPDIIHVHGIWMLSNHVWVRIARKKEMPCILSTRGMLDPWALMQKSLKKKLALWLYQRRDLKAVTCFHATAEQEVLNIRAQRMPQPIIMIPNGVELPSEKLPIRKKTGRKKIALFLSRLHPGKGLMELVSAWRLVAPKDWKMRVVGPDVCRYRAVVEKRIERLGLQDDFEFIGELDDKAKWQEYVNADLFIHPSHSENFGVSIAEALAAGVPVITTKGTPWKELEFEQCGWWIDIGVEPLVNALREAMSLTDEQRRMMGENGRHLVESKYTWPAIAEQMRQSYEWVVYGGEKPTCVRMR